MNKAAAPYILKTMLKYGLIDKKIYDLSIKEQKTNKKFKQYIVKNCYYLTGASL